MAHNIPEDRKYTKFHTWVRLDKDNTATIGISDYAQSELGDVVHVQNAVLGKVYQADSVCAEIESVKTTSDVYIPITGEVIAVNQSLVNNPELINTDPYEQGWLCKLSNVNAQQMDTLMTSSQYNQYLAPLVS